MQRLYLVYFLFIIFFVSNYANAIPFDKPITASVVVTKQNLTINTPTRKEITLMNIKLTPQQKSQFFSIIPQNNKANVNHSNLPSKIDLGMNNVPVLDQGKHGSCVTFATTAAIDALLRKGDYLSQLCQLELGNYLEQVTYKMPSGWDNSSGSIVLNQIHYFGIISKDNQKLKRCAGVSEYPVDDEYNRGNIMSLEEYEEISEDLTDKIYWESMLTYFQRFQWNEKSEKAEKLLSRVKKALAVQPDETDIRISFEVLLPYKHCSSGACAQHHKQDDTWALTNAIVNDKQTEVGGHEMIITGYDDNAVAIDNEGKQHQGLLILRNSWGDSVGDHGNYYMTYDFFKSGVYGVQKILGR